MNEMIIGGIATLALVAGLFFFRFWRATGDRFFLLFAIAFWLEGLHRYTVFAMAGMNEASPWYYLVRLFAYGLILAAVIDKNRTRRRQSGKPPA